VLGSLQSLPDGQLVLFLADHPTTGGYPVVAVVEGTSLGACAQARPGSLVRFRRR
jgi:allophanate hydrolase subunit 2